MTELKFDNVSTESVFLDGTFENGVYCVSTNQAGGNSDTATRILAATAGLRPPERGKVTIDGLEPGALPALRRTIGSLFATETGLPGGTVVRAMDAVLRLRGTPHNTAVSCLQLVGAAHLHARQTETLTADEHRAVALALALALEHPRVLALDSPLAIACTEPARVRARLRSLAGQCVILIVAASPQDYAELGAIDVRLVDNRMLYSQARGHSPSPAASLSAAPPSDNLEFDLVLSDAEQMLAALLNQHDFTHVELLSAQRLQVHSAESTAGSRLLEHVLSQGVQLHALRVRAAAKPATQTEAHALALEASELGSNTDPAYSGSFPPSERKQHD